MKLVWTEIKRTVYLCTRKDKSLGDIMHVFRAFYFQLLYKG